MLRPMELEKVLYMTSIYLYTCCITRTVHLDIVPDMSRAMLILFKVLKEFVQEEDFHISLFLTMKELSKQQPR